MTLAGAVDTAAFVTYVRDILCPALLPGQIVLLDNLSCHKDHQVRQLIEARGGDHKTRRGDRCARPPPISRRLPSLDALTDAQLHAVLVRVQTLLLNRPTSRTRLAVDLLNDDEARLLTLHRALPQLLRHAILAVVEQSYIRDTDVPSPAARMS